MAIKLAHQQAKAPTDDKDVSTRAYVDAAGGAADDLTTTGADVNVSGAAPPSAGQSLVADDPTSASWQTPAASADIATEVTVADTNPGGLALKIAAGANISLAVLNPGADEQLEITSANAVHALGGGDHTADTFANVNSKVSDANLAATDISQQFTKNQYSHIVTLTDAAVSEYVASDSGIYQLTATGGVGATRELDNPTSLVAGMTWQVWFIQDGTGGRGLTFDTFYDWGDEGAPDFTAQAASIKNIITCVAFSTTQIAATAIKGFA
jgi:hypothetical protein